MKNDFRGITITPQFSLHGCNMFGGERIHNNYVKTEYATPLVSVVTIVFNGERYIERAILSVLSQSYDNIEYVVVDGGSSDATLDILRKYDNELNYWCSAKDKGISDAFNRGVSLCNGEFVGILNADDWYDSDTVSNAVAAFKTNPAIGVVHGDLRMYKNDKFLFAIKPHINPERIRREMIYNHPACFVKRDVYLKLGGFNEKLKIAMDYEFLLRAYLSGIFFSYSSGIIANMQLGGQSDSKAVLGFYEMFNVSVLFGYSKMFAYVSLDGIGSGILSVQIVL
jgi:GT2 family glycosyltransferase